MPFDKDVIAVNNKSDASVAVCSVDVDVPSPQGVDRFGMRMTEKVAAPAGNHGDAGRNGFEKHIGRRLTASVMGDLQNIAALDPRKEVALRLALDVAGQEDGFRSEKNAKDDGAVVFG